MSIKYASFTVNIHGLDTDINHILFLKGWIREAVLASLKGKATDRFNWRNEFDSDLEVVLEETAGIDPEYKAPVCKNCQHWNLTGTVLSPEYNLGRCNSPKFVYGYGSTQHDPDGIAVEDDEGWGTVCGPEFGCIHYEERSNDPE